ncbi:two-component regulator propeller domain-containing protein [Hugenholtzia roseola]|uniref:two-component regulator propeller domain-containing protein n=1 Tax=Hugenholtzia roseola TaxID=1002 RepID=UPI0012B5E3C6|nr:two-component regulator propeller domain-containing protein [Hugenholtzia roseola]
MKEKIDSRNLERRHFILRLGIEIGLHTFLFYWVGSLLTLSTLWGQALNPKKQLSQYIAERWDTEAGLSSSTTTRVRQNSEGYLWVTSYLGINRFDGVRFTTYDPSNIEGLHSVTFADLFETPDSALWFVATGRGGLVRYQKGIFRYFGKDANFIECPLQCIAFDKRYPDLLFLGSIGNGLFIFDRKKEKFEALNTYAPLVGQSIPRLLATKNGKIWAATENNGVVVFDYQDGEKFVHHTLENTPAFKTNNILSFLEDKKGRIWVGTRNGLLRYENKNFTFIEATESYSVMYLLEDEAGTIWIGTTKGLGRLLPNGSLDFLDKIEDIALNVTSMSYDREGSLWVSLYRNGLVRLRQGKFENYTQSEGMASLSVNKIYEVEPQVFLVGTDAGIINIIDERKEQNSVTALSLEKWIENERVRGILKDSKGNLWIASYKGVLKIEPKPTFSESQKTLFSIKEGLGDEQARLVFESEKGDIWIGTRSAGISILHQDGTFSQLNKDNGKLPANFIMQIKALQEGKIAVATNNAGIAILDQEGNLLTVFDFDKGLADNRAFGIYEDVKENAIWIATSSGISIISQYLQPEKAQIFTLDKNLGLGAESVFDITDDDSGMIWFSSNLGVWQEEKLAFYEVMRGKRAKIAPRLYNKDDGMKSEECTGAVHFCKAQDGKIWIPTLGGVSVINPNKIPINAVMPSVYIEKVLTDTLAWQVEKGQVLELEQGWRRLNFEFTALSFIASEKVTFKYQLVGYDKDWIQTQSERRISYTSLPPGKYEFKVLAANHDGIWNNEGASIHFIIKPYWYQQKIFYLILVLSLLLLLGLIYRWRIQIVENQKQALERIVQERTAELNLQKEEIETQKDRIEEQNKSLALSLATLEAVSDIGKKITTALELSDLSQMLYDRLQPLMPLEGLGIGIFNATEKRLEFKFFIEKNKPLPSYYEFIGDKQFLAVQAFLQKEKIWLNRVESKAAIHYNERQLAERLQPEAAIYLPLVVENRSIGVMTVQSYRKEAFTEKDITLLQALAVYVGIALDNASAYEIIRDKNRNITDSIRYALTIQESILPTYEKMNQMFEDYFILFKPKDIVSGDFYWLHAQGEYKFVAAVDCTGHGVPGAFMSMIGSTLLTDIVSIEKLTSPAAILKKLNQDIKLALKQDEKQNDDGMDIALCVFKKESDTAVEVVFAGAKRPLYYTQNGEIYEIRGDKYAIGGRDRKREKHFQDHSLSLQTGAIIYLTTDGYGDQANDDKEKIGSHRLKEMFKNLQQEPLPIQKEALQTAFEAFRRDLPQRDDVTILGLQL